MSKQINSSDSDQNFRPRAWLQTKSKLEPLPNKAQNQFFEGKKTVKYRDDPEMVQIYEKILRESDKFKQEQIALLPQNETKDIYEYDPHIVHGKMRNVHICSEAEKSQYHLDDEGFCQQYDVNDKIRVIIVGKVNYHLIQGIHSTLFLPRQFYEFINAKKQFQQKLKKPTHLIQISNQKYGVIIKRALIDKKTNIMDYPYFVIDPTNLLYPTYICSWIQCKRRITISNYVQSEKIINQAVVFGSACHRLMQWLAQKQISLEQFKHNKVQTLLKLYKQFLYDMYITNQTFQMFKNACENSLDNIANFYENNILKQKQLQINKYTKQYLKIQRIISSEQMFNSRFFGLKGKIDMLLAGKFIDRKNNKEQDVYIPFELKTSKKVSDAHKRQTEIYNILIRQKFKKPVIGLLYYSDTDSKIYRTEDPVTSFQIIIVHRNQIALNLINLYSSHFITLPSFSGFSQCNFCEYSNICQLSNKSLPTQSGTVDLEQVPSKYYQQIDNEVKKFTTEEIAYFKKWMTLIHYEELQTRKVNTDSFKIGINHFKLPYQQLIEISNSKEMVPKKIRLTLNHRCRNFQEIESFNNFYKISQKVRMFINSINLIEGCKIIQINNKNKVFQMTVEMNNATIDYNRSKLIFFCQMEQDHDVQLETFETQFHSIMRNSVYQLINSGLPYLKKLVIEEKTAEQMVDVDGTDQIIEIKHQEIQGLNSDQAKAYKKAIHSQNFCLIEGMPGTGKTELIIKMIQKFAKQKKTILVTTYTNRSLDNILQRLIDSNRLDKNILVRQGSQYSYSKQEKGISSRDQKFDTIDDYKKFYSQKKIWFVTLSSLFIHHLPKKYDIVILDEASQCLQPVCLQALHLSQKFILIGDYKQLQPVIRSQKAISLGMGISLFERLCKNNPNQTVALKKQYRMNEKIMNLSNELVYDGQLQIASNNIKNKCIHLSQGWKNKIPYSFQNIFDQNNSIRFINYDPIINAISKKYIHKEIEIKKIIQIQLACSIYRWFISSGILKSSIAIITAYNASVNKIAQLLIELQVIDENRGNILTIDKSQGIDKQIIILLVEQSNNQLLDNPRRLNVALTRAKSKLIVIGSQTHLERMTVWKGNLAKLLSHERVDLSKLMIQDMLTNFSKQNTNKDSSTQSSRQKIIEVVK